MDKVIRDHYFEQISALTSKVQAAASSGNMDAIHMAISELSVVVSEALNASVASS